MRIVTLGFLAVTVLCAPAVAGTPDGRTNPSDGAPASTPRGIHLQVSAELLAREVLQSVDRELIVRDVILGVPLKGNARLKATTRLELLEDHEKGVFELILTGTAVSTTTGDARQAMIRSHTVTRFSARKQLILDEQGLHALPARCRAEAHSTVTQVSSSLPGLRGRLSRRVAWQRAQAQRAVAERISARHTEQNICRGFDADVARDVRQANVWLADRLKKDAVAGDRSKFRPPQFQTSADRLRVSGLTADLADLAAVQGSLDRSDVALRLVFEGDHLLLAVGVGEP